MTIHDTHPFADPDPDPVRRLRGRLGGAVTLWTADGARGPVGLTVSSVMLAAGETAHLLALVDPDSDLADALGPRPGEVTRATVSLLAWRHRDLADVFAGTAPSPGGPFRAGTFDDGAYGPRLRDALGWAQVRVVDVAEVGWSSLLTCAVDAVELAGDSSDGGGDGALLHRRGRYRSL